MSFVFLSFPFFFPSHMIINNIRQRWQLCVWKRLGARLAQKSFLDNSLYFSLDVFPLNCEIFLEHGLTLSFCALYTCHPYCQPGSQLTFGVSRSYSLVSTKFYQFISLICVGRFHP